jgi:hypothetical protein
MLIGHYCQQYTVSSSYFFSKHNLWQLDIRKCSNLDTEDGPFKVPSPEDQLLMEARRRHNSMHVYSGMTQKNMAEVERSRDVWMIDHVVVPIREALQVYFHDYY